MLKPLSMQREYSLVAAVDPALDLPVIPELPDDAPAEDVAARDKIIAERREKYQRACDTGSWPIKPGEQPTVFDFRQFPGAALDWLLGEMVREKLIEKEVYALAFRIALSGIKNFGNWKPSTVTVDGHRMISDERMEEIYGIGGDEKPLLGSAIIEDLGRIVFDRATQGVRNRPL